MSSTFLKLVLCSSVLLSEFGCRSRAFNSKPASSSASENAAEYKILNTGPKETVLYHYSFGEYFGVQVAEKPRKYLEKKFKWGAERGETRDTTTKAGPGVYTAHDPLCATTWGGPRYKNSFEWHLEHSNNAGNSVLFLLFMKPNIQVMWPKDYTYMNQAIKSPYPIVLGGACQSYTLRDIDTMADFKSYDLNAEKFKPIPFGKIVLNDIQTKPQNLEQAFETSLKNWFGLHMFLNSSAPAMVYAWQYTENPQETEKRLFDPEETELEISLLAGLALYDMNSFSETAVERLKKIKKGAPENGTSADRKEKIEICLDLLKKLEKAKKPSKESISKASCGYVMLANTDIETLFKGVLGRGRTVKDSYPAPALLSLMLRLETQYFIKFDEVLRRKIEASAASLETSDFQATDYVALLKEVHRTIVEQYWTSEELNNAKRYLKVLRTYLQLNAQMSAGANASPDASNATP